MLDKVRHTDLSTLSTWSIPNSDIANICPIETSDVPILAVLNSAHAYQDETASPYWPRMNIRHSYEALRMLTASYLSTYYIVPIWPTALYVCKNDAWVYNLCET